jgi:4-amino-4-deoxy-L-arabinose transferase-like glycosyltransferase
MTLSVLLGAGLALLWAIPAGQHGGEVYRHAIFWGQTANRMVSSFAHQRPAWWYGMMLPVFLFPWLFWPRLLGALWRDLRDQAKTTAPQFVLIWLAGGFLIFSAISGKQPHYLLPEMPAAALLISHAALRSRFTGRPWLPATLLFVIGGSVTYYAISLGYYPYFTALGPIPFWAGAGFLLAGGLSLMACRGDYPHLRWLAWANWVAMVWILLIVVKPLATLYDTQPLAQHIARYQESGREVGHAGKYHAQFQFSGRLTQPLTVLQEYALPDWLEQHQTAVALIYLPTRANITPYQPLYAQPFHTRLALIVDYHAAAALRQKHDSEVLEKEND